MSRYVKDLIQKEFEKRIADENISDFIVVDTTGMDAVNDNSMRSSLRQKDIRLLVVKNSLFKRALSSCRMDVAASLFEGSCSVVYGAESIVDAATELAAWAKKTGSLEVKGAYLDGSVLDKEQAQELVKMPTRQQMIGRLVGCLQSPGSRISAILESPAREIAGCIESVEKRCREQQGKTADR